MKMYKKSELKIINGLLVGPDGDVVTPNPYVINQANELETLSQKAAYLMAQPSATPAPNLDDFERLSGRDKVIEKASFEATTPILDLEAARAMAIMDEIDDVNTVNAANKMLKEFTDLLEFVNNDYVVDYGGRAMLSFDMPTLGSVLELTQKDVTDVIAMASGLRDEEEKHVVSKRITDDELDEEDIKALLDIISKHDPDADDISNVKINVVDDDAETEKE